MKVVVSNGVKNFFLSSTAVEASYRGNLLFLFTGVYPTRALRRLLTASGLVEWPRAKRLFGRAVDLPEDRVRSFVAPDVAADVGVYLERFPGLRRLASAFGALGLRLFARQSAKTYAECCTEADIYHYRSGFGLNSVAVAKSHGAVALCDHSIAHPAVLNPLVQNSGRVPSINSDGPLTRFWACVLEDISQSDHIVVNSDFVRDTFAWAGADTSKVSVIYLGVDDAFLDSIPPRAEIAVDAPVRMMYAGALSKRKGADALIASIAGLPEGGWTFDIAGPVEPAYRDALRALSERGCVRYRGNLTRRELAKAMTEADVFVFPSLAEGSARVVFEAMACGCFVITTRNAGSIVQEGVHGRIVPPGDPEILRNAMADTLANRASVCSVGLQNAALIRCSYTQSTYGDAMDALYRRLIVARQSG